MKATLAQPHACTNCGVPYHPKHRLRQGRCHACYQHWRKYGNERANAKPRARKQINVSGRMVYGKSCPRCGGWMSMRATHCHECAQLVRWRGESC